MNRLLGAKRWRSLLGGQGSVATSSSSPDDASHHKRRDALRRQEVPKAPPIAGIDAVNKVERGGSDPRHSVDGGRPPEMPTDNRVADRFSDYSRPTAHQDLDRRCEDAAGYNHRHPPSLNLPHELTEVAEGIEAFVTVAYRDRSIGIDNQVLVVLHSRREPVPYSLRARHQIHAVTLPVTMAW